MMNPAAESEEEASLDERQEIVVMETMEMEMKERQRHAPKFVCALLRYVAAATVALVLTIISPDTRLWQRDGSIHVEYMFQVIFVYILTLGSLYCVAGSNPGYLNADVVDRVCQEDGLTLLGYEEKEEAYWHGEESQTLESSPSHDTMTRRIHCFTTRTIS